MSSERVVVTGSSGTLGHHLLRLFAAHPDMEALALLRAGSRTPQAAGNIRFERVDFFATESLRNVIRSFAPTCVIHCAASGTQFPKPDWFDLIRFNVDVSLAICECLSTVPGCRLVYVGTGLAYRDQGRPLREDDALDTPHPYGASKAAADILIRSAAAEFGVPLTVVRPFSFTGEADEGTRLFPSLLRAAAEGRPMELSPGDQIRDHCAAEDIAAGIFAAAFPGGKPDPSAVVYNLGSGNIRSLRDLLEGIVGELGLRADLRFGARDYARFEPMCLVADTAKAKQELAWTPRTNLAHAVWRLARTTFPSLQLKEPKQWI